jgi:hypothetical protein
MVVEPLAEGYLLRAPAPTRSVPAPPRAVGVLLGEQAPKVLLDGTPVPSPCVPRRSCSPSRCTRPGSPPSSSPSRCTATTATRPPSRGEILRLRNLIGADVLRTRPYRLDAAVDTDVDTVRAALRAGRPADALRAAAGPLLPRSDAPDIRELRDQLDAGLRRAVLDADDVDLLAEFAGHPLGRDDLEVHDLLAERLPPVTGGCPRCCPPGPAARD